MLPLLAKVLKVLNSEASPWQIGWAIALGLFVGILPFGLLTLLLVLLVCLLTINLTTFILVWGLTEGLMLLFVASGFLGVWFHYQVTTEFQLEMDASLTGWALFRKAIVAKAPPALAPGAAG